VRNVIPTLQHAQEAATVKLEDEANHAPLDPPQPSLRVFAPPPNTCDAVAQDDGPAPMAVGEGDSVRDARWTGVCCRWVIQHYMVGATWCNVHNSALFTTVHIA